MAMTVHLDIVSAEASIFSGLVEAVIVPGKLGEMGLYPGHTALLSELKPGLIRAICQDGKEEVIYCSGGVVEVQPKLITILSDTAARAADLDEAAALEAKERAEKLLSEKQGDFEYSRAVVELAEATAQIRAIQRLRKQIRG